MTPTITAVPETGETITATAHGVRTPWDGISPAGILPRDLVAMLDAARVGDDQALQSYAETILERDAHTRALINARVAAVTGPDHVVEPASQDPADLEIAEVVREQLVDTYWWGATRRHLAWAPYYGYAVAELVWTPGEKYWDLCTYNRPNRWFVWDADTGTQLYLRDHRQTVGPLHRVTPGIPIAPGKIVVHASQDKPGLPVRSGLVWPLSSLHVLSAFAIRSWADLAEKHGQPQLKGHVPTSAGYEAAAAFATALANFKRETSIKLPPGFDVEALDVMAGGHSDFHQNFLGYLDRLKSKLIRGQTMTSDDGSSLSQAKVHKSVAQDQTLDEARKLDDTMSAQIIGQWCGVHFSPRPYGWPRVVTDIREAEDVESIGKAFRDVSQGLGRPLTVTMTELRRRLGFSEPEEGDELSDGVIPGGVDDTRDIDRDIDRDG